MRNNEIRNYVQQTVVDKWAPDYYGYAVITMGVGKSRIIAMAINKIMDDPAKAWELQFYDIPILILVNSRFLRDVELMRELKKWGCNHPIKVSCYQSAYKWNKTIGLIIGDELDFSITKEERYINAFRNNVFKYFLGLTGTMIADKLAQAIDVFKRPPFYTYTLRQAQEDGVINKVFITLHEVPLLTEPSVSAPMGEAQKYAWVENKIKSAEYALSVCFYRIRNWQDFPREMVTEAKTSIDQYKAIKKYWESSGANPSCRVKMMKSSESSIAYAKKLKELILQDPKNKVIIFGELTDDVDAIADHGFHGKKGNKATIESFNSGEIRELGVCKKVNRGVNFENLNQCIVQSYSSSETDALQGYIGRMVRLDPSEVAYIHILYSCYTIEEVKLYCKNLSWALSFIQSEALQHINKQYYINGL